MVYSKLDFWKAVASGLYKIACKLSAPAVVGALFITVCFLTGTAAYLSFGGEKWFPHQFGQMTFMTFDFVMTSTGVGLICLLCLFWCGFGVVSTLNALAKRGGWIWGGKY
jgi:hypothetical protein